MPEESQGKSEKLVERSADPLAVTKKNKGRIAEVEGYFDVWVRCCDEADMVHEEEQKFKQCFGRYKATQKKLDSNPRRAIQRVRIFKVDVKDFMDLIKEQDTDDMYASSKLMNIK